MNIMSDNHDNEVRVEWSSFSRSRGLLGLPNQKSVDYIKQCILGMTINGKKFRAWSRGEFGFSTLVTVVVSRYLGTTDAEYLVKLFLKQNKLEGTSSRPTIKPLGKGLLMLRFGACPQ